MRCQTTEYSHFKGDCVAPGCPAGGAYEANRALVRQVGDVAVHRRRLNIHRLLRTQARTGLKPVNKAATKKMSTSPDSKFAVSGLPTTERPGSCRKRDPKSRRSGVAGWDVAHRQGRRGVCGVWGVGFQGLGLGCELSRKRQACVWLLKSISFS